MSKKYLILSFLLFSFLCSNCGQAQEQNTKKKSEDTTASVVKKKKLEETKKADTITVIGVGDMMLGTNYPKSPNYLPPGNDCMPLLADVIDILKDADLTFGNCEGTFSDKPEYARKCNDPRWCYRFSMPEKYAQCFKDAGFDLVSIANNHMGDLGSFGRKNTVRVLQETGLHYAGLITCPTDTFSLNGVKYGFCAFAPNDGTCRITDYDLLRKRVQQLKKECQIVIVSFHGGAEGRKHEHLTRKTETFLGQNRGNVYKFAHTAVDAGADIVFGHGPHVTRAVEVYKKKFIAYSMGNFCTYRRFSLAGVSGIAPILKLYLNSEGDFLHGKITATYQDKMKGTKLDPANRVVKRMQQLVNQDIPESVIRIEDSGEIVYK